MIYVGVRTRIETGPIREKHSFTKHIPQSPIKTLFLTTVIIYFITENRIHKASPVNMIIKSRNIHTRAPSVTANFAAIHEPIILPAASVIPSSQSIWCSNPMVITEIKLVIRVRTPFSAFAFTVSIPTRTTIAQRAIPPESTARNPAQMPMRKNTLSLLILKSGCGRCFTSRNRFPPNPTSTKVRSTPAKITQRIEISGI